MSITTVSQHSNNCETQCSDNSSSYSFIDSTFIHWIRSNPTQPYSTWHKENLKKRYFPSPASFTFIFHVICDLDKSSNNCIKIWKINSQQQFKSFPQLGKRWIVLWLWPTVIGTLSMKIPSDWKNTGRAGIVVFGPVFPVTRRPNSDSLSSLTIKSIWKH